MTTPRHLLPLALAALLAAAVAPANAAPKIDAFTVDTAASQSTIRFTAESGSTYELQRASVLAPAADWATIDTRRAAADGPMELTDGVPAGRTRSYYRIAEAASSASTYLVVDMIQGTSAAHWPVTVLDDVPEGGWSDEYKLNKLVLRRIPAGTFTMGSPESELGRRDDETPHQVTLSKPYYMGVFEVTQAQWMLAMGSRGATGHEGNTRPKDSVSYDEIRGANGGAEWPQYDGVDSGSFLYVLREKTGLHFDLPTEAQWEYACRAGTSTALNSGKDITDELECPEMDEVGRYEYNQDDGKGGYSDHTTAVGSYLPNAWGLYDMHGNVEEWCLDWDGDYGTQPVTDPKGPDSGNYRVMRGGCFSAFARQCRSAFGTNGSADGNTDTTGFRLACADPEPQYLVVDLSGGPTAERWPVAELPGLPADAWQTYWGPGGVEEGWTDEYKTTKLVLRRIPAGTFTMSSPTNETGRYSGELLHEVTLSRPCYMGVFEVTQKQWELATGTNPSQYPGDTRPVDSVSYDAVRGTSAGASWPAGGHAVDPGSFIGILREKTGLDFDLPTEAQWEYACRAGTGTSLNSGKNITTTTICTNLAEVARYYFDAGRTNRHAAVGSYLPNAWGLYDCHGNVWEWCLDWYGDYPADAARDPAGADSGTSRVLRGGSWNSTARDCRSANRSFSSPEKSSDTCGLRLACPVAPKKYLVVDLSNGRDAPAWPVTELDDVPPGGWTTEHKTTHLVLRHIPAGSFTMGSPTNELGRKDGEIQHQVTLTRSFYMGVFEVTQKQWELAMGSNPSQYQGDARPVEQVSYEDIRGSSKGAGWPQDNSVDNGSFLAILRQKTGLTFDLPTEAQWEYACRAGTTTALNSGQNLTANLGCTNLMKLGRFGYSRDDGRGGYEEHTTVGSYQQNAWDLYDMHGNVYEWCLDWVADYDAGPVTDPEGASSGSKRAYRGGDWSTFAMDCRSAARGLFGSSDRVGWNLGLRLSIPLSD